MNCPICGAKMSEGNDLYFCGSCGQMVIKKKNPKKPPKEKETVFAEDLDHEAPKELCKPYTCKNCNEEFYLRYETSMYWKINSKGKKEHCCISCARKLAYLSWPARCVADQNECEFIDHFTFHKTSLKKVIKQCHECGTDIVAFRGHRPNSFYDEEGEKHDVCRSCSRKHPSCVGCGSRISTRTCPRCGHKNKPRCNGKVYKAGSGRTVGIEIECNAKLDSQEQVEKWGFANIKDDNSLRGDESVEFTSPHPLYESNYKDWLKKLLKIINPTKVYNKCGLHIHIGDKYSWLEIYNILKYCRKWQDVFFSMVSPSRYINANQRNITGAPMALPSRTPKIRSRKELIQWLYGRDKLGDKVSRRCNDQNGPKYRGAAHRYRWVNIHSYFYRGTIEIRLHHGTTNFKKISMWVDFWLSILPEISTGKVLKINPLDLTHKDIKRYYNARIKELAKLNPNAPVQEQPRTFEYRHLRAETIGGPF